MIVALTLSDKRGSMAAVSEAKDSTIGQRLSDPSDLAGPDKPSPANLAAEKPSLNALLISGLRRRLNKCISLKLWYRDQSTNPDDWPLTTQEVLNYYENDPDSISSSERRELIRAILVHDLWYRVSIEKKRQMVAHPAELAFLEVIDPTLSQEMSQEQLWSIMQIVRQFGQYTHDYFQRHRSSASLVEANLPNSWISAVPSIELAYVLSFLRLSHRIQVEILTQLPTLVAIVDQFDTDFRAPVVSPSSWVSVNLENEE